MVKYGEHRKIPYCENCETKYEVKEKHNSKGMVYMCPICETIIMEIPLREYEDEVDESKIKNFLKSLGIEI